MTTITLEKAEGHLLELMQQVNGSHSPIHIVGRDQSAVVISAEDWAAIEETLHLQSIPGMTESIRSGFTAPDSDYAESVEW